MAANAHLKNEFTEDEKYHNLMRWLNCQQVLPVASRLSVHDPRTALYKKMKIMRPFSEIKFVVQSIFWFPLLPFGDNCIQNVHLGRYIVGYMVGNFVLRRHVSRTVKRNFRPYNLGRHTVGYMVGNVISDHITDDIPPKMKILNMIIPILMHF